MPEEAGVVRREGRIDDQRLPGGGRSWDSPVSSAFRINLFGRHCGFRLQPEGLPPRSGRSATTTMRPCAPSWFRRMTLAGSRSASHRRRPGCAVRAWTWRAWTRPGTQLEDEQIAAASLVAFYLPMHTATRLAAPLIARARRVNPVGAAVRLRALRAAQRRVAARAGRARTCSARKPRATWLRWSRHDDVQVPQHGARASMRAAGVHSSRSRRAAAAAALCRAADARRHRARVAGSTDATRGCKHLCRHCPIVPVYAGQFRVVPVDVVIDDIRAQVEAGAQHISFGDPDFLNGPTHARRVLERARSRVPGPDLRRHDQGRAPPEASRDARRMLRETGCLFITSAVESVDDEVLGKLREGAHPGGLPRGGRLVPCRRRDAGRRPSCRSRRGRRSRATWTCST